MQGKTLLLDLFSNDQGRPSDAARRVMQTDILGAYISVASTVTDFVRDWLIDGWLPRIYFGSGVSLRAERFLGLFGVRRCDNGDLEEVWFPQLGGVFRHTPARLVSGLGADTSQLKGPPPTLTADYEAYLRSDDFRVALTLIPYDGYRLEEAKRVAEQTGRLFLELEPAGLQFWDLNHLIAESRDLASQRVSDPWAAMERPIVRHSPGCGPC